MHYAGLGRRWSDARELVFRARLEEARSSGAVLVLLRHGESDWNASDRFTGWEDVGITEEGRRQATRAGHRLARSDITAFDDLHSSALKRTVDTLRLTVKALNDRDLPSEVKAHEAGGLEPMTHCRSWQLNERHYGALTGMKKCDARNTFGKDQVQEWRRGWHASPPPMGTDHASHKAIQQAYVSAGGVPAHLPPSESLADTELSLIHI